MTEFYQFYTAQYGRMPVIFLTVPYDDEDKGDDDGTMTHGLSLPTARRLYLELGEALSRVTKAEVNLGEAATVGKPQEPDPSSIGAQERAARENANDYPVQPPAALSTSHLALRVQELEAALRDCIDAHNKGAVWKTCDDAKAGLTVFTAAETILAKGGQ